MVTLQLRQMVVYPGDTLHLRDVDWAEFEAIVAELGDRRSSRIAYVDRILELRMPLPKHEVDKELIGDMVKILLEELDIDNECFGSTTFKRQDLGVGVEPDQCFYIQNSAVMIGKRRLNLTVDPPPDLVIEVDVTSKTGLEVYRQLGVPEVWRFENGTLQISVLDRGVYQETETSAQFPNIPIAQKVSEAIIEGQLIGRSKVLKTFRLWVRSHLMEGVEGQSKLHSVTDEGSA
jgi:Uma2 family endonuclease